ncbi:dynamin family protein [uncultured Aggregatibacter sp.]|uniref:dynamin family protein n=1 Tax=uncultured Aggregatibacter sp. TaxID=470564 RepID=UPI0028060210|nr:dynamin family protein [uncultured Aggregatibacter sp.]
MRNELKKIAENIEQTSRLGYLFGKGNVVNTLTEQLVKVEENITALEVEKTSIEKDLAQQTETLTSVKRNLKRKEDEIEDLGEEIDDLQTDLSQKKTALREVEENYADLSSEHNDLTQKHKTLLENIKKERTITKLRENLVGALISAKNENEHLSSFRQIFHNEFLPFASEESSLQNEAGALLQLQEIEKELAMISGLPSFYSARTIAVGGGFSAGKSEFISSFFKNADLKLPRSIEPTTAIPTYVVNQKNKDKTEIKNSLIGINNNGAAVDLLKIDPDLTQKLSHQFMRSFNFPLKSIMPYMFLTTELTYEHICFVDTPGYNPTGSHTAEDMAVAKEFLANADALIWLVGADVNGTLPRTDIQFLKSVLGKSKKPVYFVLNKADVKPEADIVKIIKEFSQVLEREKIAYIGISAYDSLEGKGLLYYKGKGKKDIFEFLNSMNKFSNKQDEILCKLYEVERDYQFAIKKDIKQRKTIAEALDNIAFDLNEENFKRGNHKVYDQLDIVAAFFNTQTEEKHLKTLEKLMTDFTDVINQMFGKVSQVSRPVIDIDDIQIEGFDFEELEEEAENEVSEPEEPITQKTSDKYVTKVNLHDNLGLAVKASSLFSFFK